MRIDIHHQTTYHYEHPVRFSAQYLRLTPLVNPSQRVFTWSIEAEGRLSAWTDGYGNPCHTLVCDDVIERIHIVARGTVDTNDTSGVLIDRGTLPANVFLRQTSLTAPDPGVADFAETFRAQADEDRLPAMHALADALAERIEYQEGETHVHSTAADVLRDGAGVCQDMAHLFISCARYLGVPTRYVSGYLYTGEDNATHVASHAWAAAWIDDLGWVSFDIANKTCGTERHVGLAVGLDYAAAAPIRGVRHGGSEQELMEVQVRVAQA